MSLFAVFGQDIFFKVTPAWSDVLDTAVSAKDAATPAGMASRCCPPNADRAVGETEYRLKTEIPCAAGHPGYLDGQLWLTTATEDGHDFYACVDEAT